MNRRAAAIVVANGAGAALLAIGWWGASRRVTVSDQIVWVNVSVFGVAIAGFANTVWLFTRHHEVTRRAGDLGARSRVAAGAFPSEATGLVAVPGLSRYHYARCQLVAGRAGRSAVRAEHERLGRRPCGVCRP